VFLKEYTSRSARVSIEGLTLRGPRLKRHFPPAPESASAPPEVLARLIGVDGIRQMISPLEQRVGKPIDLRRRSRRKPRRARADDDQVEGGHEVSGGERLPPGRGGLGARP